MTAKNEPASGGASLDLVNWLRLGLVGLWRYRVILVLGGMLGTVYGTFKGLTTPNQFRSFGKLFVRAGARDAISPDWAFGGGGRSASGREALMNVMQMLTAPQLYSKTVERLGIDNLMVPYDPAAEDDEHVSLHTRLFHQFQSWWFAPRRRSDDKDPEFDRLRVACTLLADNIRIVPEHGASVITVSYVSHAPEIAQAVVNAVLESAREVQLEVVDSLSSVRELAEEAIAAEETARLAEEKLREFRVGKGIYDFDSQRTELLSYLAEIDRQIDAVAAELRLKAAERQELDRLKAEVPETRLVVGAESSVLNPLYGSLQTAVLELQRRDLDLELSGTGGSMTPAEFKRRKDLIAAQLNANLARLQQEGPHLELEGVRQDNPQFVRLLETLEDAEVALGGLAARRAALSDLRTAKQGLLRDLESLAPQLRVLELDARQKRSSADRLSEGVNSLRTAQRLEQMNMSSVGIMVPATYEPGKVSPGRGRSVIFGGAAGLVLGVGVALLLTLREPRLRTRYDIVRSGVPGRRLHTSAVSSSAGKVVPGLPQVLAKAQADIDRMWLEVPYDRRSRDGLRLAFLPADAQTDAGRAAAAMAIGLAVHGGERVVYVGCSENPEWLAQALELPNGVGWSEVLRERFPLDTAVQATSVPNLSYLPLGSAFGGGLHPLAGRAFLELLDQLTQTHRFVVLDLPVLAERPEVRSVLAVVEAAQVVVTLQHSARRDLLAALAGVRDSGARLLGCVVMPRPLGPDRDKPAPG